MQSCRPLRGVMPAPAAPGANSASLPFPPRALPRPPQRGRRQQPSRCMCFAGACLPNEKLLWVPLWAFQEGLARFLQSRHGETVCFSKYVRDFSSAWLWQGLSAVVSSCLLAWVYKQGGAVRHQYGAARALPLGDARANPAQANSK